MVIWSSAFVAAAVVAVGHTVSAVPALEDREADPCVVIAGQTFVIPSKVISCLRYLLFHSHRSIKAQLPVQLVTDVCSFNLALSHSILH